MNTTGSNRAGRVARSWAGAVLAVMAVLAGCGSAGDDAGPATTSPPVSSSSTEPAPSSTSTTPTSATTGTSAVSDEVAMSERLIEPIAGTRRGWIACIAEPLDCDFDVTVAPFTSGPVEDSFLERLGELQTERRGFRGADPEVHFVSFQVTRETPLQAAVLTCSVVGSDEFVIEPDGTETVTATGTPLAIFTIGIVEEQADGSLTLDQTEELDDAQAQQALGDVVIEEADSCDQFEELPS